MRNIFLPILSHRFPPAYFAQRGELPLTTAALNSLGVAPIPAASAARNTAVTNETARVQKLLRSTERLICQIDPKLIGQDRANNSTNPFYRSFCTIYFIFRKILVNPLFCNQLLEFRRTCTTEIHRLDGLRINPLTTRRLPPPAPASTARDLAREVVTDSPLTPQSPTPPPSSPDFLPTPVSPLNVETPSPEAAWDAEAPEAEEMATPHSAPRVFLIPGAIRVTAPAPMSMGMPTT